MSRVVVVGGGAAGLLAAGRAAERGAAECGAAERGADVLLLEKTPRLGNKLRISGKGRGNITTTDSLTDFVAAFGPAGRFLYGACTRFFRDDLLALLQELGIDTVTERGGRVFPSSQHAPDIAEALVDYARRGGVQVRTRCPVERVLVQDGCVAGVQTADGPEPAGAVVVAVGGASYPGTGSTGDGVALAWAAGHTVVPLRPALVPLETAGDEARQLQGLSLRHVRATALRVTAAGVATPIASEFGEMLFTHFGVSGPIILTMSRAVGDALRAGDTVVLSINLKPALTPDQLDRRLQRDLAALGRRAYHNILSGLLPRKLIDVFIARTGIPADRVGHQITAQQRADVCRELMDFRLRVTRPRPLAEAIVTAGGVALDEVDPRTLMSRRVPGLFFAGEVLDLDGPTGGYNLQAAFSTGYVAGQAAAEYVL
ncbi:MAG: NAD(P)/FAD-dependent oxidoreductase [Chloroflexi bacterium]|nr:NAD(P)/FAD-dependent oxidoreductase [Chloroflexota bacterium]MBU1878425.1 NAD(P)/FAD-dependent oxidoreductase [Chloroflexota bacterium]